MTCGPMDTRGSTDDEAMEKTPRGFLASTAAMPSKLPSGAIALALLLSGSAAWAHDARMSRSDWAVDGGRVNVAVTAWRLDLSAVPEPELERYLTSSLTARAASGPCSVTDGSMTEHSAAPERRAWRWSLTCPSAPTEIRSDLLFDLIPGHLHVAHVRGAPAPQRSLLDKHRRSVAMNTAPAADSWLEAGLTHALEGLDHLVFLALVIAIGGGWRRTAALVTGFTAGHSISLALAVFGWVHVDASAVELGIALTIVTAAVEAARRNQACTAAAATVVGLLGFAAAMASAEPLLLGGLAVVGLAVVTADEPPLSAELAVTVIFGMVHGLGFAGALSALGGGGAIRALLAFNVGVELGQLGGVLLALAAIATIGARRRRSLFELASTVGAGVGAFWVVARLS